MNTTSTPFVYIVNGETALCDSLLGLLESVGLQAVVVTNIEAIVAIYKPHQPSCLLLNAQVPRYDFVSIQRQLHEIGVDTPVIIIAGCNDVSLAVAALKQGALDFIEKPFNDQVLLDCVHSALSEDSARRRDRARRQEFQRRFETLTPREQNVLQRIVEGLSNQEIAMALSLSRKTVEVHRAKVMHKMRADTLAQLIRIAMAIGILNLYDRDI